LAKKIKKSKKKSSKTQKQQGDSPVGKLVEIEAKLPLTDRAKVERGEVAAAKLQERDKLVLQRKDVANQYKAKIDALTSEATKLLLEFSEGREVRTVKAREIRNFAKNEVEYLYKGQVIYSRALTLADRQDELPIKDKTAPLPKVSAVDPSQKESSAIPAGATVTPIKRDAAPATNKRSSDSDNDLSSVIKEETSVRSKWSAVDGAKT
jgi:hypothetical protein